MAPRYDVFLSHSSADKPAVEQIARKLRDAEAEPFLDKWHLVPGEPWQEALEEALDESRTCAVFLGPGGKGAWQNEGRETVRRRGLKRRREPGGRHTPSPGRVPWEAGEPHHC